MVWHEEYYRDTTVLLDLQRDIQSVNAAVVWRADTIIFINSRVCPAYLKPAPIHVLPFGGHCRRVLHKPGGVRAFLQSRTNTEQTAGVEELRSWLNKDSLSAMSLLSVVFRYRVCWPVFTLLALLLLR